VKNGGVILIYISCTVSTRFQAIAITSENKSVLVPLVLLGARNKFRGVIVQVSHDYWHSCFSAESPSYSPHFLHHFRNSINPNAQDIHVFRSPYKRLRAVGTCVRVQTRPPWTPTVNPLKKIVIFERYLSLGCKLMIGHLLSRFEAVTEVLKIRTLWDGTIRVDWWILTDVSKDSTAFIFRTSSQALFKVLRSFK
jgi:hypothetical protein